MIYETARPLSPFIMCDGPRIGYGFGDDLMEFIASRLDKVDPYRESEEYCRQQERVSRLHDEILIMLPEAGRAMLREYSEALGAANYLEVALLGERAF